MFETLYRVENDEGFGPYNHRYYGKWNLQEHCAPWHPGPQDQGFKHRWGWYGWRSGFRTMDQLKNWFHSDELQILNDLGLQIVETRGIVLWESECQLIFVREGEAVCKNTKIIERFVL